MTQHHRINIATILRRRLRRKINLLDTHNLQLQRQLACECSPFVPDKICELILTHNTALANQPSNARLKPKNRSG